ncbi:hypothetical protein [Litorimonas sp.]|uniref:DoxX family protein n=1 Tax=Litorimonas sp. TaxID=1892381 RepID=UPI003A8BD2FA
MLKSRIKSVFCWVLALFFLAAGILLHFMATDEVAQIVPPFLPFPKLIVIVTGVLEILFAIGLIWPKWRRLTGIVLSVYLLAVLPANIYMALENMPLGERDLTGFQLWFRVALQFPLIALVLWASGFWEKPKSSDAA